jgi:O-antigen/teichoic acid export membrane protein
VFSREIVVLVSTPEYASAADLVPLLVFGHILFVIQNVFNVGIILKRKTAYWSGALVIETVVCVMMWLVLAPRWNTLGVALGAVIGYAAGAAVTLVFSRRYLKIDYEWRRIVLLVAFFPIAVGIGNVMSVSSVFLSVALKGALVVVLMLSPFLIRFWHPDEISAMKRFIHQLAGRLPWRLSMARSRVK